MEVNNMSIQDSTTADVAGGNFGILGRLSSIWTALLGVLSIKAKPFTGTFAIKRPANVTQYTAGNIITSGFAVNCAIADTNAVITPSGGTANVVIGMAVSGTGVQATSTVISKNATTVTLSLPCTATNAASSLTFAMSQLFKVVLLGPDGNPVGSAGQTFEINEVVVKSSNGAATTLLSPQLCVYSSGAIMASPVDHAPFVPTDFATCTLYAQTAIASFDESIKKGSVEYELRAEEKCRRGQLDASGCMWIVLLDSAGYTPASGEQFQICLKGILH
jgi:hypothetical protein